MVNFGFRAHDFGVFDSAASLAKVSSSYLKNCCLHFAPNKVFSDAPRPLTLEWAEQTHKEFSQFGVSVAVLGCYINPVHPNPEKEEQGLKSFENCIQISHALGSPVVATETGSLDPANVRCEETWSERTIDRFYRNIERLLNCAVKNNTVIALEAVSDKNTIDTPQRMLKVMETFESPNLRVLFDAVNILPINGVDNYVSWFTQALEMLSPYICAMHIKDFEFTDFSKEYPNARIPVKNGTLPVGEGIMPWADLMALYKKYNLLELPMTLENFKVGSLSKSLAYIRACCS